VVTNGDENPDLGKRKVTLDFHPHMWATIESMAATLMIPKAEVVREAVSVFALMLREVEAGSEIRIHRRDGNLREVLFTVFEKAGIISTLSGS
jgi:hypothetical protein